MPSQQHPRFPLRRLPGQRRRRRALQLEMSTACRLLPPPSCPLSREGRPRLRLRPPHTASSTADAPPSTQLLSRSQQRGCCSSSGARSRRGRPTPSWARGRERTTRRRPLTSMLRGEETPRVPTAPAAARCLCLGYRQYLTRPRRRCSTSRHGAPTRRRPCQPPGLTRSLCGRHFTTADRGPPLNSMA